MKLEDDAALFLMAAEIVGVDSAGMLEWADRCILALDILPTWLIGLSTSGTGRLEDAYSLLRQACNQKLCDTEHRIITVIHAHGAGRLTLADALMCLWRIWDGAYHTQDFPEDFADILVEWDCLDNPTELPPDLESRCTNLFESYRADRGGVDSHYRKPENRKGQQAEDGDPSQRPC